MIWKMKLQNHAGYLPHNDKKILIDKSD